jgi:ABC-type dipeptide/oligopeptide/nickel transport system ATPase subunit
LELALLAVPAVAPLRSKLERVKGVRDGEKNRLDTLRIAIKKLEEDEELLTLVSTLLRSLIDKEVEAGKLVIERLQTEALQAVFDDQDLSLRADLSIQRNKVAVELVTIQKQEDGTVNEGVSSDAFGGSVTTVESVLMRIVVILRRDLRRMLLLDESLPAFDPNYVTNMAKLLSLLCSKLKLDILLISHNPVLIEASDNAHTLVKKGNTAKLTRLR